VLGEEGIVPEYAVVRDAETLEAPWAGKPVRRLIAARVGTGPGAVRLIDNM
jgi:pantothenate synthetase